MDQKKTHGGARRNSGSKKGQTYNVKPKGKTPKTLSIDSELLTQLEQRAKLDNRSLSNLVETIARDYLKGLSQA